MASPACHHTNARCGVYLQTLAFRARAAGGAPWSTRRLWRPAPHWLCPHWLCGPAEPKAKDGGPREPAFLTEVCLDLETGAATTQRICPLPSDFPQVPPSLVGRPTRIAYMATLETDDLGRPVFDGIAKVDLQQRTHQVIRHGPHRLGGEAVFVPSGAEGAAEDDGYLVTLVHDSRKDRSELVVYDAATASSTPVAAVPLPRRVPFGFHALWVPAAELEAQLP